MNALDTNVWLYAYDSRDPGKQEVAQQLISDLEPLALLWQVGCEFVAAARKLERFGFAPDQAWEALAIMQEGVDAVLLPSREMWTTARDLQSRFSLHFSDALIVAGCLSGGVSTLYSEDFSHGVQMDGLTVVNPFVSS